MLTENCPANELDARLSSVVLIIFNYDRCIEHFLVHSLQNYHGMHESRAADLVAGMEIYHPYGSVGPLPFGAQRGAMDFGGAPDPQQLLALASDIKTFTEGTDPESSEILAIREHIRNAGKVVFLGFAFHKLNLRLLTPPERGGKVTTRSCFATALGISDSDCDLIRADLAKLLQVPVKDIQVRSNLTCNDLFHEYSRGLSLA